MTPPSTSARSTTKTAQGRLATRPIRARGPAPPRPFGGSGSRRARTRPKTPAATAGAAKARRQSPRWAASPAAAVARAVATALAASWSARAPLPAGDRHGVANVDEGGRYHRGEEPARQRPARDEDREVGRRRREQPGRQDAEQRQPHHPHTPEPVGEHPPDRLHQAVEEVVQARRRRHLGERDAEAGRDGHQHRRDGELSNVLRKAAARRSRRGPFRSSWPRVSWASIASTA